MKFFAILFFTVIGLQSEADVAYKTCGVNCVQQVGVPVLTSTILSVPKTSDQGCPNPGSEVVPQVEVTSGKALASQTIISGLLNKASGAIQNLKNNSAHCGECKQDNLISAFTTSEPQQIKTDESCATPFVRSFQNDLNNSDIESFVDQTLRGKNPQGVKLSGDCSKTCSFHIASAQTALTATTTRLNLVVVCGPQRQGALVVANYQFGVGIVHQWICKK